MGIDVLERQLREKVAGNLKNFIKGLHLFDYNRDGKVQKHEMRKVIENYCFRMTDEQYDRWVIVKSLGVTQVKYLGQISYWSEFKITIKVLEVAKEGNIFFSLKISIVYISCYTSARSSKTSSLVVHILLFEAAVFILPHCNTQTSV